MSVRFNGSTNYLEFPFAPKQGEPISIIGFYLDNATGTYMFGPGVWASTGVYNGFSQLFPGNTGNGSAAANKAANSADSRAQTVSGQFGNAIWRHSTCVFPVLISHYMVSSPGAVTGTFSGSNNFTVTPDRLLIGTRYLSGGHDAFYNGCIAEVGIISGIVSNQEEMLLGGGVRPDVLFDRSRLLFYAPLKTNLTDIISGLSLRPNGLLNFASHPAIQYKRRKLRVAVPSVTSSANITETASAVDTVSASLLADVSITETAAAVDTVSALIVGTAAIVETANAVDTVSASLVPGGTTIVETMAALDIVSAQTNFNASIHETASITDLVSANRESRIVTAFPDSLKLELPEAIHDFTANTGDIFAVALFIDNPIGVYGPETANYSEMVANGDELPTALGYTTGGFLWTAAQNITPLIGANRAFWSWSQNPFWLAASFTTSGCLIYNVTKGGRVVYVGGFGEQTVPNTRLNLILPVNAPHTAILSLF